MSLKFVQSSKYSKKPNQNLANTEPVCYSFLLMYGRTNQLEACQVLLSKFYFKKNILFSAHAQNKFVGKFFWHWRANCSAPKTVTRVNKGDFFLYFTRTLAKSEIYTHTCQVYIIQQHLSSVEYTQTLVKFGINVTHLPTLAQFGKYS